MVNEIEDYSPLFRLSELSQVVWFPFLAKPTEEVDMFARSVSCTLKPGRVTEFNTTFEKDVIPVLRKQNGFQDEITFIAPGEANAVCISLWDRKENADAYVRNTYPAVLKSMEKVVEGTPQVLTYEVSNSTFHKIPARVAV